MADCKATQHVLPVLVIIMTCTVAVEAGDGNLGLSADLVVADSYLWRGVEVDDSWSLQPSLTLSYRLSESTGLALNGWWNIALDDHGSAQWQDLVFEQDFTLSLDHALSEELSLSAGYIFYSNPRSGVVPGSDAWQTDELFLGLSWQPGPLGWSATLYRDIDLVKGWYLDLATAVSLPIGSRLSWDAGAQLWLVRGVKPGPASPEEASWYLDDGLVSGSVSTGLGWSAGRLRLAVSLTYSRRFDDWREQTGLDQEYLWTALSLGIDL